MTLITTFQKAARLALAAAVIAPLITVETASAQYLEDGGMIAIEIEDQGPNGWASPSSPSGFSGDGFLRWDGPNYFSSPGNAVLTYQILSSNPGNYTVRLRNRHDDPDPTMANDTWVRMNNGPWIKMFSNNPNTPGNWNWESRFELPGPVYTNANFDINAGLNTLQFSARSRGFMMDRIHLYLPGTPGGTSLSTPLSASVIGSNYCTPAALNSRGEWAGLNAVGFKDLGANDLRLRVSRLPAGSVGMVLASQSQGLTPFAGGGQGTLCVDGSVLRMESTLFNSGASGSREVSVDLNSFPPPYNGAVLAGQTWNFQVWYRDANPQPTSNFSSATSVTFE
ncbi:hypothetical protein N9Z54_01865 [Planctomycetota bacterium]|jgi:hypothetical protein|nr:hypothetical protein [Planctomycetota bacterium]